MKIGYLVPEFPGQTHAFFWREIAALREQGHDVVLLSTRRPRPGAGKHTFADEAASGTTYIGSASLTVQLMLGTLGAFATRRILAVVRYVASCKVDTVGQRAHLVALALYGLALARIADRRGLDHLHVHSCADAAHLAAVQHLVTDIPYSLSLHGDLIVYGRNHRLKMAKAKFVAAVTAPLQAQVRELMGWPAERVPVVQMGVDTARFAPTIGLPRPVGGTLSALTIARLNPTKGHRFALAALRRVVDAGVEARYVIAGDGEERARLEEQINELGLSSAVTLTGTVSEDAVVELLHEADTLILPSYGLGEAAPVAVMEAMSCGLPVVATTIGGTPDMIAHRDNGLLVPQEDVDALVVALQELAADADLRRSLGSAAREHALEAFDFRRNAQRLGDEIAGRADPHA